MLISNIINDSFGLITKQLRFYCWHFRRNLDQRQRQELVELLYEQRFESLANKIKSLNQSSITDCRQQVGKLLFDHCFTRNRRHQLIQLIESGLVDINVRLDNYGRTLLHRSAYNLDLELVEILIKQGVNIRLRDYAGNTALHIAIQSYRNGAVIYGSGPGVVQNLTSIIKLLLKADRDLQNERSRRKRIRLLEYDTGYIPSNNIDQSDPQFTEQKIETNDSGLQTSFTAPSFKSKESKDKRKSNSSQTESNNTVNIVKLEKLRENYCTNETKESECHVKHPVNSEDTTTENISPILLEDVTSPLVDTKNAFGRTALHYCVLVVGEQYLPHFFKLLISFGADVDAVDTRMRTPLYCLVKRLGVSAISQKCLAIKYLIESGCDDLGLAIDIKSLTNDEYIKNLERNLPNSVQARVENSIEPIFKNNLFKRVPSLKHISRLNLIRLQDKAIKLQRQVEIFLPKSSPQSLNYYINRKILDQSELF